MLDIPVKSDPIISRSCMLRDSHLFSIIGGWFYLILNILKYTKTVQITAEYLSCNRAFRKP